MLRCDLEKHIQSNISKTERITCWLPKHFCFVGKIIEFDLFNEDKWTCGWKIIKVHKEKMEE